MTATATASTSRIVPSETSTPSRTATPSPSAFSSPTASTSVQFPDDLPIFSQPGGANTGQAIIQLRTIIVPFKKNFGDGIAREVQEIIARVMDISLDAVIVVRISEFDQATVIVCTGDIDGFFNSLNSQDEIFDNTVLDNAYCEFIFWGVPCDDPLNRGDLPSVSNGSPEPETSEYYYDFSTFRFPQNLNSPPPGSPPALVPSSRYVSGDGQVIIPIDDDDIVVVNVNGSDVLKPFVLFSVVVALLLAVVF